MLLAVKDALAVDIPELIALFPVSEQLGTASVLLGYLFDVPEVLSFLNEDTGSYVPLGFLDESMGKDSDIIDQVLRTLSFVFGHLRGRIEEPAGSASLHSEENPLHFLLRICS